MSDKPFLIQQKLWLDPNEKIEAEKFQQIWSERVRQLKLINEELSSVQASELKDLAVRAVAVRDTWKHQLRLNERYPFPEEARQFLSRLDNLMEFIEKNQEAMHHFERHPVIRNAHPYGGALGSLLKSYRFAASLQREHQGNVGRKRNLLVRVVVSDAMSRALLPTVWARLEAFEPIEIGLLGFAYYRGFALGWLLARESSRAWAISARSSHSRLSHRGL